MDKVKIILKVDRDGMPIAFFPEMEVNRNRICAFYVESYHPYNGVSAMTETSLEHYDDCIHASRANSEVDKLYNYIKQEVFPEYNLIITKRLNYNDLRKAWKQ